MNYLVIGCGSIGKRHIKNILKIDEDAKINVFDPDENQFNTLKNDINNNNVRYVNNLDKSFDSSEIAIICSPNHLHIEHSIEVAKHIKNLFIEKPLSHNLETIDELINLIEKNNIIDMVACNMRFYPNVKAVKEVVDKNILGKMYAVRVETGYFLPYWRPHTDYRKGYGAFKEQGGGAALDCIHEVDLLLWFGGNSKRVKGISTKVSNLEIETEDIAIGLVEFDSGAIGEVHLDYIQRNYSRSCKIIGEKSTVEWDFLSGLTKLYDTENKKWEDYYNLSNTYDLNQMYIDEMNYFLDCVKNNKKSFNTVNNAKNTLEVALKIRAY